MRRYEEVVRQIQEGAITELGLGERYIDLDWIVAISEALKDNNTVTMIDLSSNQIGDEGIVAIAEGLKVNSTVTVISLNGNQIGDEGAVAIADSLKVNSTVTTVNLNRNQIGDEGAVAIADMLKVNSTVTRIDLHYSQIGDAGAVAIADALEQNPYIRIMYVDSGDAQNIVYKLLDRNQRIADRAKVAKKEATTLLLCADYLARQNKRKRSSERRAIQRVPRMVWKHKVAAGLFDAEGFTARFRYEGITYIRDDK